MREARCFRCDQPGETVFESREHRLARCPTCRMSFVDPHPEEVDLKAYYDDASYFDQVYPEGGFPRWQRDTWERSRLSLADRWRRPDARLLEVGCAHGTFLAHAAGSGWAAQGVEMSASGAEAARQRTGLPVHTGTLESAELPGGHFAAVCAFDVIEHVPDPAKTLGEMHRILEPGGGLVLTCPNVDTWPPKLFKGRWWTLRPMEHLWHFEPATLRRAVVEAGFEPLQLITSPLHRSNLGRFDSMTAVARKA